jgi:branched-chain amino acid transport system ATP-binding protein
MLNVSGLSARYGSIRAVEDVSFRLDAGQLITILGANGAGKSTTLRCIAGLHRPSTGTIELAGEDVTRLSAHQVVRRGLALVPEGRMVVAPLTVSENLSLSAFAKRGDKVEMLDKVFGLFPRLKERRSQVAGSLSGGEQQMLAFGRALMTSPQVLLLDEPSMGLAPVVVDAVYDSIIALHDAGQSIVLVEQNAAMALPIADFGYVLQRGSVVAQGTSEELNATADIKDAYLG